MNGEFVFMLPHLIEKGLIQNDSDEYALVMYDRATITRAAEDVVKNLGSKEISLGLTVSKKRVKFLMEFMAVALSMAIENCDLMETARSLYRGWFEDAGIFGSIERQNKYLRRMVKQLSLPFALRYPSKSDRFQNKFAPLLAAIITDIDYLLTEHGSDFEKETWLTVMNVCIGICDVLIYHNIQKYMMPDKLSELKKSAISCCFNSIMYSGIKDEDVWKRFTEYCQMWSSDIDFLAVWNKYVNSMFSHLLETLYKKKVDAVFIGGIYSMQNPISGEMVQFLFHNLIELVYVHNTSGKSELLLEIANTISRMVQNALQVASSRPGMFKLKFPASSLMKLFGKFITFATKLSEEFDQAVAINVDTMVNIIAFAEQNGAEEALKRLLCVMLWAVETKRSRIVTSFLSRANDMFAFNNSCLPIVSKTALSVIPMLTANVCTTTLLGAVTSLFISSSEVLKKLPEYKDVIHTAYDKVWSTITEPTMKFPMICYAQQMDEPINLAIINFFETQLTPIMICAMEKSIEMLIGCIHYIGYIAVTRPDAVKLLNDKRIVPTILSAIKRPEMTRSNVYPRIVFSGLQMIINLIQWTDVFKEQGNLTALFDFVLFVKKNPPRAGKGCSCNKSATSHLNTEIVNQLNLRCPSNDHFSRILDSSNEINEEYVIKKLGITDHIINYYTVDDNLLISFIEKKNGDGPLVVFARGPFGRTVWTVSEDLKGEQPTPGLSQELATAIDELKSNLPKPTAIQPQPLELRGDQTNLMERIQMSELYGQDDHLRQKFGKDFSTWLDWDEYSFYGPHGMKHPTQRPRVIDFLAHTGMFDTDNSLKVRPQEAGSKLSEAIKQFDLLQNKEIVPITVTHILPSDESVAPTVLHNARMTPLMVKFFREIGEAMKITPESSKMHNLPELRTSVPTIPCFDGFAAIISAAMIKSSDPLKELEQISTCIKIIFNETEFEIKNTCWPTSDEESNEVVLIVKPSINDMYHVWQVREIADVISPFTKKQLMSVKTLAFNLGLLIEMTAFKRDRSNIVKHRRKALADLVHNSAEQDCGLVALGSFKK